jgi:nitrite reductase (NAD(P)H)
MPAMPVLDGLRYGEPVDGSPSPNHIRRQKIVIVGLGMVAISLM